MVISVIASPELRRNRIMIRDNITEEQADSRIASQHEDEFYTQQSDYVLENSGDMAALRVQLLELLDKLEREDG